MAVIINDFEVVIEEPERAPQPPLADLRRPASEAPLDPLDVCDILRRKEDRERRVYAH